MATPEFRAAVSQELKRLQTEIMKLEADISEKTREKGVIVQKIEAARLLLGEETHNEGRGGTITIRRRTLPFSLTLVGKIRGIMKDGASRSPSQIRELLQEQGVDPEKISSTSPFFYNTLSRLVSQSYLIKDKNGLYMLNPNYKKENE